VILCNKILDHLSRRFSAKAFIVRSMWANGKVFKRLKFRFSEIILKLAMNDIDGFQGEITSSNTRLIGYHKKIVAKFLKNSQCPNRIRKIFNIFNSREVILIQDECTVPI
jgi:hypothetical protein